jgi:trans-aconitate methyltransferase
MARTNPWSLVSAAEYEAAMGADGLDLLTPLSIIFAKVYAARQPRRLAVVGVATGNGLEHVRVATTGRTIGVDVNLSFLGVARQRFMRLGPALELLCADLEKAAFAPGGLDLVHAALVLEYVDIRVAIPRIASWLAPGGALAVVLRLDDGVPDPAVAESVLALSAVTRLVPPGELRALTEAEGLVERRAFVVPLASGRRLFTALYERPDARRVFRPS